MKLAVNGAGTFEEVPGLSAIKDRFEIAFAPDEHALGSALSGADVLLGWNFRGRELTNQWQHADRLKWIHWCGAGVDAALFPELVASDVVLTNARGLFDTAMAEYVAGYMLSETKDFRTSWHAQQKRSWNYRLTAKLAGQRAIVFGVGSIGREVGRLLRALGVEVDGVGRSARAGDRVFGTIHAQAGGHRAAADADWVIGVMPSTAETDDYFSTAFFAAMKPGARFINIGRGRACDETALENALRKGALGGAMLDVFREEPLPEASSLWDAPNLVISPHMSGDYGNYHGDMTAQFLDNLDRFMDGKPLLNVADKNLGFVPS